MANILLKFSLVVSILGILFLLLFAKFSLQETTQGRVISIKDYSGFKIIKLDNNQTITCGSCQVKLNQTIQVQGRVAEYKGQKQISANKIEIIKNVN